MPLAAQAPRINLFKLDPLGRKVITERAGLLLAQLRQYIIIVARPRLRVAYEIDEAQLILPASKLI
jgi:hypothetical protein